MKIYLASSWRNTYHSDILFQLRDSGFEVYDFKNPTFDNKGFSWQQIDKNWEKWTYQGFTQALYHPIAIDGFKLDFDAMKQADCCVLLLPSGRSAHLEAGYFVGANKPLFIHIPVEAYDTPELMYKMAVSISGCYEDLDAQLQRYSEWLGR